jgi:hypothetical protein
MANARWKQWRANVANRPDPEPKMKSYNRFEYGVRDKLSGEEAWRDLVSVRQAAKALGLIKKFY